MAASKRAGLRSFSPWERIFLNTFLFELATPIRNRVLLAISLFIFSLLMLFRPFNLHSVSLAELLQTSIGSAVIFFFVGFSLNSVRARGQWVFAGKPLLAELVYVLAFTFLVGLLVYVARLGSEDVKLSWRSALQFQAFAFAVGIVSILVSRLLTSLIKLQRDIRTRDELHRSRRLEEEGEIIILPLSGNEEEFSFPYKKWITAKAAGNYIELYFDTTNHKPVVLVRTTLKILIESMQQQESFFRCHRSFVVNLDCVSRLRGNSQAYKLELSGLASPVPVARNSEKQLLEKLSVKGIEP